MDLRARRRAAGLSQEAIARLVPCSTNTIRLFEKGYAPPRSVVRERLLTVLDALAEAPPKTPIPRLPHRGITTAQEKDQNLVHDHDITTERRSTTSPGDSPSPISSG